MDYIHWNNLVAEQLFKPSRQGQEVFLYLTEEDLLQAVRSGAGKANALESVRVLAAKEKSIILNDLWDALRRGPAFWTALTSRPTPRHPAEYAKYAWQDWGKAATSAILPGARTVLYEGRKLKLSAPLHLLYLACFTLPFSLSDTAVEASKYYDSWNRFFGEPRRLLLNGIPMPGNALAQLGSGVWIEMWKELARWSQEDLKGEQGILVARQLGGYVHVGWPQAQCLLPPAVLGRLPSFFGRQHLLPGVKVAAERMQALLLADTVLELPAATRKELQSATDLGMAVVDMVLHALSRWTGAANQRIKIIQSNGQEQIIERRGDTYANLLPFLPVSLRESEIISWHYRVRVRTPLPEKLTITGLGIVDTLVKPETSEWSSVVPDVTPSETAQVYYDEANRWKLVAQLPVVQVFVPGGRFEFYQYWVPVPELEHGTELLVLCQAQHNSLVQDWGQQLGPGQFGDWSEFEGLPEGYSLFWLASLPTGGKGLPGVTVAAETRLVAQGGLRCANRDYLAELPPGFRLLNGQTGYRLGLAYVNGSGTMQLVSDEKDKGLWHLPSTMQLGESFRVIVEGQPELTSLPYKLLAAKMPSATESPRRGRYGEMVDEQTTLYYDGACLGGEAAQVKAIRGQQQIYIPQFTPGY
jgi:hypothetical protein